MRVERPFAHCCAEAGGNIAFCDCVNKDHGTAFFDVARKPNTGADHARNYRQRQREKIARMTEALQKIVDSGSRGWPDGDVERLAHITNVARKGLA